MLILNDAHCPIDRVATFLWARVERERMTTVLRLFGRLIAYLPQSKRSYYAWQVVITYRPAQYLSVYQFSPAHARLILFSHWEFGLVLGHWLLGARLRQPLVWLKRLQMA